MSCRLSVLLVGALVVGSCGGGTFEETPPPEPASFPADGAAEEGEASVPERLLRNAARSTYRVYVSHASSSEVSRVGFVRGRGAEVERTIPVGGGTGGVVGTRGIVVSPDGSRWYVSASHRAGPGSVWQFATDVDTLVSRAEVGAFPAALSLAGDGSTLFVVHADLEGDGAPSGLSVVDTPGMTETVRVTTCVGPRGSRVDPSGERLYSVCFGSEQLVELDARSHDVTKRFSVAPGREGALPLSDTGADRAPDDTGIDRFEVRPGLRRACAPTWVEPATGTRAGRVVFVACSEGDQVLVVSTERWEIVDRYATGAGPHQLEATADGRYLLATLEGARAVAVFDLDRRGEEVARVETSDPAPHGVVASPDSRYAFVSSGTEDAAVGTVDVIDLRILERVATARLGPGPRAMGFWEIGRLGR